MEALKKNPDECNKPPDRAIVSGFVELGRINERDVSIDNESANEAVIRVAISTINMEDMLIFPALLLLLHQLLLVAVTLSLS